MIHLKSYILGLLFMLPLTLPAQSLELLGLFPVGDVNELKAQIDLQGKSIRSVSVYSFNMTTGENATTTQYDLIENKYLTATPPVLEGVLAYRMRVVLNDETVLLTPCIVPSTNERFMWLGDIQWESAHSGWDSNHPPRVDQAVDSRRKLRINDTIYHKGVSSHANGHFAYQLDGRYTRFVSRVGVQDEEINGDVRVKISTDNTEKENFVVYSLSNTGRGSNNLYKDIDMDMRDVTSLRIDLNQFDGNTWGDHTHVVMARLYLPEEEATIKQPQQITFSTQDGVIPEGTTTIRLNATATSGGAISYRIVKGTEFASIENGNELTLKYGVKGEILVEATQYGNDQYACVNAMIRFETDLVPSFELLTSHQFITQADTLNYAYFYLDTRKKVPSRLVMKPFNNVFQLIAEAEIDLMPYLTDASFNQPQVIQVPIKYGNVLRFAIRFPSQTEDTWITPYYDEANAFEYVSDMKNYTSANGYGGTSIDKALENLGRLNLCGQDYGKGFGIHANGWLKMTVEGGKYNRFVAHAGKQRGRGGKFEVSIEMNDSLLHTTGIITSNSKSEWDYKLDNDITLIKINLRDGGDGIGQDHGSIGAPRFYFTPESRMPQSLQWLRDNSIHQSKPFTTTLEATATSGLPVFYHILKGNQYATIENGNQLNVHTVPDKDSIVIEAFQPGNNEWAPAEPFKSVFSVTKGRIVHKNERIELENGEDLEELTVYGDASSLGQVVVKSGLVNVKRLILKYTFVPRAWNFISFPTNLNIEKISNFNELGYEFNGSSSKGAYYIQGYDTQKRAENPTQPSWTSLTTPRVEGLKGYIMGINDYYGNEPKEVTFTIDNVSFDFESTVRLLNLTLDLTNTEPGTSLPVYISPANAKGNTLKVEVAFQPANPDELPVNYRHALKEARITFTPNKEGIRLTLPDPTPAKVAIYDRKMKKLLKAVHYSAPMMIDVSDLKSGSYQMIISYGNATDVKSFIK